jgi:hypothetical protein
MFKISFRISPFQEFNIGSLVTYRDENLVDYIKESLYSRSNFFYVESLDWKEYECKISNGIDSILSTPDQLIEVVAYVEKIDDSGIKSMKFSENVVENIARWQNEFDNRESYILEDQKMAVFLENVSIPRKAFALTTKVIKIDFGLKNYIVARFDDEAIHKLL